MSTPTGKRCTRDSIICFFVWFVKVIPMCYLKIYRGERCSRLHSKLTIMNMIPSRYKEDMCMSKSLLSSAAFL